MKPLNLLTLLVALWALSSVGCNTFQGFGKDMERAGENIQRAGD
jgi:predicted small secreted protein